MNLEEVRAALSNREAELARFRLNPDTDSHLQALLKAEETLTRP